MHHSRISTEKQIPSENLREWRIVLRYRLKDSWSPEHYSLQFFIKSQEEPTRKHAQQLALAFASDWTGFPQRRLMVSVYTIERFKW